MYFFKPRCTHANMSLVFVIILFPGSYVGFLFFSRRRGIFIPLAKQRKTNYFVEQPSDWPFTNTVLWACFISFHLLMNTLRMASEGFVIHVFSLSQHSYFDFYRAQVRNRRKVTNLLLSQSLLLDCFFCRQQIRVKWTAILVYNTAFIWQWK